MLFFLWWLNISWCLKYLILKSQLPLSKTVDKEDVGTLDECVLTPENSFEEELLTKSLWLCVRCSPLLKENKNKRIV